MVVQPATAIQGPQLSAIRSADPAALVDAITNLLSYVNGMFNFAEHKKFNTIQVSMLANDIAQRYWQLKFDEVVYVLREGTNGRYHTFDRLDPGVIHGWFTEYIAERDALVEQLAHNQMIAERKASEVANTNVAEFINGLPQSEAPKGINVHRSYLKSQLSTYTDEDLQRGANYYAANPRKPEAALKLELAKELIQERADRLARATAEAKEKARQMLVKMKEMERVECRCDNAQPGEVCPDCHDSGWIAPEEATHPEAA